MKLLRLLVSAYRVHCAYLRLYWYNGQYSINLFHSTLVGNAVPISVHGVWKYALQLSVYCRAVVLWKHSLHPVLCNLSYCLVRGCRCSRNTVPTFAREKV